MKVVILAGGFGTRITEESYLRPKPMIEIGGQPILWHIMKYYSSYGFHDFVICLGYKQYVVKEYFADYFLHTSDVTFDLANNSMEVLRKHAEPWKVTLIDTGLHTMTGEIPSFREKDDSDGAVINGGFMVCEPGIFDYIEGDDTVLEQDPFRKLCSDRELVGYYHKGFWQCMDTQREKNKLEELWESGNAPWKRW